MATSRLLRTSSPYSSSSSLFTKCVGYQRKQVVVAAVKATTHHIATSQPMVRPELIPTIRHAILPFNLQPQLLIETVIINCRFFTLFAVAGSLLGSVLCFVEGCLIVIDSYARYFHILSQRLDPVHLMRQLIEAIDMFLVGSALLVFGMGLYAMFVGSSNETGPRLSGSNLLGLFYMKSMAQAKGKVGHAVMMIVQAGVIEKLKDIPLVTSLDLACFAAAVLTSSALSTSLISLQY